MSQYLKIHPAAQMTFLEVRCLQLLTKQVSVLDSIKTTVGQMNINLYVYACMHVCACMHAYVGYIKEDKKQMEVLTNECSYKRSYLLA